MFYYVLTKGKHPFGDSLRRQANILSGDHSLDGLPMTGTDSVKYSQTQVNPVLAPTCKARTSSCKLKHLGQKVLQMNLHIWNISTLYLRNFMSKREGSYNQFLFEFKPSVLRVLCYLEVLPQFVPTDFKLTIKFWLFLYCNQFH